MTSIVRTALTAAALATAALAASLSAGAAVAQAQPSATATRSGPSPVIISGMTGMMPMPGMMAMAHHRMDLFPTSHVEGRIAFLKAELGITEAQMTQWTAFADSLRQNAQTVLAIRAVHTGDHLPTTLPTRLDAMLEMQSARLEALKSVAPPARALYGVLSDAQKRLADELMLVPAGQM